MKIFLLATLLLTTNAFACWNMKAVFSVDSQEVLVDQKIEHDKTYSFPAGPYIFHVKIPTGKKTSEKLVNIEVVEKNGIHLTPVSKAELITVTGKETAVTQLDQKTNQLTSMKLTLTDI